MDLSQIRVQEMWETGSPLKQVPHFDDDLIKRCKATSIESVYDIMEMEDEQQSQLLQMTATQMYIFLIYFYQLFPGAT